MNVLAEKKPGMPAGRGVIAMSARVLALLLAWCGAITVCRGAALQDMFTNRETITATSGRIVTNISTATIEVGEPKHGGKTGGHSMWISWVAPSNGIATFETDGSRFDTLLAVYYFSSTNDTTLDQLLPAASTDDSEGFERECEIEFGVLAGQRYEIAVDGYFGATGLVEFKWDLKATAFAPPVVLNTPGDRSANIGDPVALTVVLTNAGSAQFKWFFNGNDLGITTTNLFIPSMQVTNVGRYKLRIDVGGARYFTAPTEIQINTDGETHTLAQSKILDAPETPLIGTNNGGGTPLVRTFAIRTGGSTTTSLVRGYNGSQIFDTTYATVDPAEPPHCGISNGVSYWLVYQPPTNGTITLDTVGSTYDTVMEVYTFNGTLTGYQDLIPLDCNNDAAGLNGASRVITPVVKSRQYVVVVEGVNGARGRAWVNYSLNTNQLPVPPTLLSQPTNRVAASGSDVLLGPSLIGSPPLRFSWKKNQTLMQGQTLPSLFLPGVTTNDSASYVLTVTNDLGSLTATLPLRVVVPTHSDLAPADGGLMLSFPTIAGQRYTVEEANTVAGPWQPWPNFYIGDGTAIVVYVLNGGTKFYRVRVD